MHRTDLDTASAAWAMREILSDQADAAQIAAFATLLRSKGETVDELAALVNTMREFGVPVSVEGDIIDTCGTGGDRSGTLNVSTAAAIIAAAAGARVVKHGNRAASSQCGSADVLEALGVEIALSPEGVANCVQETGIGFCFAPDVHPALRFAVPTRKALGVPTTFNFLGPLANPARPKGQSMGVSDPDMAQQMIGTLDVLGAEHAIVFYGHDGLDELTTTTTSTVLELRSGEIQTFEIDPTSFGIPSASLTDLQGGNSAHNAQMLRDVFTGDKGATRDIVLLNTAPALVVAGLVADFANGLELAADVVDSAKAATTLEAFVKASQAARAKEQ